MGTTMRKQLKQAIKTNKHGISKNAHKQISEKGCITGLKNYTRKGGVNLIHPIDVVHFGKPQPVSLHFSSSSCIRLGATMSLDEYEADRQKRMAKYYPTQKADNQSEEQKLVAAPTGIEALA